MRGPLRVLTGDRDRDLGAPPRRPHGRAERVTWFSASFPDQHGAGLEAGSQEQEPEQDALD